MSDGKAKSTKKCKAKDDIVYLVSWYGRRQTLISLNVVKVRKSGEIIPQIIEVLD